LLRSARRRTNRNNDSDWLAGWLAGGWLAGWLAGWRLWYNRCENDVERLTLNSVFFFKKVPKIISKWGPKTVANRIKNVLGTPSAPKGAFGGGGRLPYARRRTHGRDSRGPFWSRFGPKSVKNAIENSSQNRSRKNMENNIKRLQNGAEIDATTNKKPMPKHVSKKIMKIMKIMFF
jgi:hypothetical protein